jgi:asparagine N-glycosylation enzyme membrane subunit Stt3
MAQHVRNLGWCFIIYSGFLFMIAVIVAVILGGAGALSGDRQSMLITGTVAVAVASILVVLSLPGLIAGFGLLKFRPWARILALIIGAVHVFSFPFGTALCIYAFWVLLNVQTPPLFEVEGRPQPA